MSGVEAEFGAGGSEFGAGLGRCEDGDREGGGGAEELLGGG